MKKNKSGFTLIEIIIVVCIVAIIGAISFSAFSGLLKNSHENNCEKSREKLRKKINSSIALNPEKDQNELTRKAVTIYGGNSISGNQYNGICLDQGVYTITIDLHNKATIECSKHK